MKKLIPITLFVFYFQLFAISQEARLDSIYFNNGKIEAVNISGFDEVSVKYSYPNEGIPISTYISKIEKVITRNGREVYMSVTKRLKTVFSAEDWKNVEITGVESEVEGLIRITNISGKAEGATEFSSLAKMQDRAMAKMQMQAAFFGCDVVYMLSQTNAPSGFWTTASSTMTGTAYSISMESVENLKEGKYKLDRIYRLRPNDFRLKEQDISYYNRRIELDRSKFFIDEDHYAINFDSGIKNSDDKMYLLNITETEVVFLVIERSNGSKFKYYNLYFQLQ